MMVIFPGQRYNASWSIITHAVMYLDGRDVGIIGLGPFRIPNIF
jgi:hypothetical protein